jgi:ureidoglycolate amidohydrolase
LTVTFSGEGGHAGATLMPFRNDAGLAAAELQLALEAAVLGTGSNDTVGTAGVVEIRPGAVNSIPREARILIGKNSFYFSPS